MAAVTAGVVATVASGAMAANAAKDAARSQTNAANAGIAEQRAAREQFQQNIEPYLGFGQQGISRLQALMENPDSIQDSTAYQWRLGQGLQALDRSAAARGGLFNMGHSADVQRFAQGEASQEYGNQWNRLMGIASLGQNAAVGAGSMAQQSANAISNLYGNIGQAQAGGAYGRGQAWGDALGGLAGFAGLYGGKQSTYQQPKDFGAFTPNFGAAVPGQNNSLINKPVDSWNFGGWK